MVELYTIMRYLQYDTLQKLGLGHFDSWAAAFGETVTSIELAPEGTGNDYKITRILVDADCHRKLHYSQNVVEPALVIQGL